MDRLRPLIAEHYDIDESTVSNIDIQCIWSVRKNVLFGFFLFQGLYIIVCIVVLGVVNVSGDHTLVCRSTD